MQSIIKPTDRYLPPDIQKALQFVRNIRAKCDEAETLLTTIGSMQQLPKLEESFVTGVVECKTEELMLTLQDIIKRANHADTVCVKIRVDSMFAKQKTDADTETNNN